MVGACPRLTVSLASRQILPVLVESSRPAMKSVNMPSRISPGRNTAFDDLTSMIDIYTRAVDPLACFQQIN
jgi:hypothetical protein